MKLLLRSFLLILGLLLFWMALIWLFELPNYLLPTPYQVLQAFILQKSLLLTHALPTVIEILLGFSLGIFCGCIAGFLLFFFKPLKLWFLPLLIISQAIPTFAIAPLLVIWLGYGLASKIVTAMLIIFFPIASSFYDGLRATPTEWLNLAKTMNAKKWQIFYSIRLPASLPSLASGIRIAAVFAPIGALIGEWVGSSQGLGYLMLNANARLQMDILFAALIVVIILSVLLYFSIDKLLKILVWW